MGAAYQPCLNNDSYARSAFDLTPLTPLQPRLAKPSEDGAEPMIDNLSLGISHGLILLAVWRLFRRADLDIDDAPQTPDREDAASRLRGFLGESRRA